MTDRDGIRRSMIAYRFLIKSTFTNSLREYFSIRSKAFMRIAGISLEIGVWGVFASLIGHNIDSHLESYGATNATEFVLSGLVIARLISLLQITDPNFFRFSYRIYHNRPFNIWFISAVKNLDQTFFWRLVELLTYLLASTLIFQIQLSFTNPIFWLVILLGAVCQFGLGLFTAGWLVLTKGQTDPVNWFFNATRRLFTGELFPPTVLPSSLLLVSYIHPQTYVNILARRTSLADTGLAEMSHDLLVLTLLAGIFVVGGTLMYKFCLSRAKREGTLKW